MSKKIKNIVLIALAFFVCSISEVGAKEVALSCRYFDPYNQLNGHGATSVLCNIYDDYSHQCYAEHGAAVSIDSATTNSQKSIIGNWEYKKGNLDWTAKTYVQEKTSCPSYLIIVTSKQNQVSITASAPTIEDAEKYVADNRVQLYIAPLSDLLQTEDQKENAINNITEYTLTLNDIEKTYNFDTCVNLDETITRLTKCRTNIKNLRNTISQLQLNVTDYIKLGLLSESDEYVVNFNKTVETANIFIEKEEKRLEEEQKKIDAEMTSAPNINTENQNNNRSDNNKSNCALFGEHVTPIIRWIIDLVHIAIPIIIIILTIIDFSGVVLSADDKNFKAAGSKLVKRLLIGAAIIFLPMLLTFIIDFSGALVPYGIEKDQLFCSIF